VAQVAQVAQVALVEQHRTGVCPWRTAAHRPAEAEAAEVAPHPPTPAARAMPWSCYSAFC